MEFRLTASNDSDAQRDIMMIPSVMIMRTIMVQAYPSTIVDGKVGNGRNDNNHNADIQNNYGTRGRIMIRRRRRGIIIMIFFFHQKARIKKDEGPN